MIPYGRQSVSDDDIEAVVRVLKSDFLTQGPVVAQFEDAVKSYCRAPFATAVSNATAGLHIAYLAAGLGPGDRLWTSPITFAATANAALLCGASVDFVDIDPRTCNMCPEALARKLAAAEKTGTLPKIVAPVHFSGQPCAMEAIHALGQKYGFTIVEDAAHAIGAEYQGRKIGDCHYSDMAVFSFHPVKIITTGEGGMVMTKSAGLHEKLQLLRTHGITRDKAKLARPHEGPWYMEQIMLGNNYRLTDLQCALGISQMGRIDSFLDRRRKIAARYDAAFKDLPIRTPFVAAKALSSWHLYVIRIPERAKASRLEYFERLRAKGLGVNVHYIPVYYHPYYQQLGFGKGIAPVAEAYYESAITLPLFPAMTERDIETVIDAVTEIFRA
jgi:UDP-4-amino-4,6-dideoxy-N-acetyl-beta-L-altrosamine transaminase